MKTRLWLAGVSASWLVGGALLGGCGGPLKYTVDDSVVENVPAGERQTIARAQEGVKTATDEKNKMEIERTTAENALGIAKHKQDVAEQGVKASKAEVAFWSAKKEWADQAAKTSQAKAVAAQAKVELEKARLVESKGIKPTKSFEVKNFEAAVQDTEKESIDDAKDEETLKQTALEREQSWKTENASYQQELAKLK